MSVYLLVGDVRVEGSWFSQCYLYRFRIGYFGVRSPLWDYFSVYVTTHLRVYSLSFCFVSSPLFPWTSEESRLLSTSTSTSTVCKPPFKRSVSGSFTHTAYKFPVGSPVLVPVLVECVVLTGPTGVGTLWSPLF